MRSLAVRFQPTTAEAIDVAFALLLVTLGLLGFRTAFDGSRYLLVGVGGAVAGALVAFVAGRLRWPPLVVGAVAVCAFYALGGVAALRDQALGGTLPTISVLRSLTDGVVNGWARLLTTVPPAGTSGNLLAVPYLCGFAGAFLAVVLGLTVRRWPFCVLPTVGILAVGILFGTSHPAALLLQGGLFAAVAMGWVAARGPERGAVAGRRRLGRVVGAVALLAVTGIAGHALGAYLPFARAHSRFVLRTDVQPPFDPRQYPSPLTGYRKFVAKTTATETEMSVTGVPKDVSLRLAVMDDFDGEVWGVSQGEPGATGVFERIGTQVPNRGVGRKATVTVGVGALTGVWLPLAGTPTSIRFAGGDARSLQDGFLYNPAADAAAMSVGLRSGDTYTVTMYLPPVPKPASLDRAAFDTSLARPVPPGMPAAIKSAAVAAIAGRTTPYDKAKQLEQFLRQGYYSDGGQDSGIPPGHSISRLASFLSADQLVGDGEQYASAMALLARSLGMPARVVMGFRFANAGTGAVLVRGRDIDAWVEIAFRGIGWVPFFPTPDRSRTPQQKVQPQPVPEPAQQAPPPPPIRSPNTVPDQNPNISASGHNPTPKTPVPGHGSPIARWATYAGVALGLPVLLVVGLAAAVLAAKTRRRRRRRGATTAAGRISGGWLELLDLARDLGEPVPTRATRRETAILLDIPGLDDMADEADTATFGPLDPTDADVDLFWSRVDSVRARMTAPLGTGARWRTAVSLASLRGEP